MLAHYTNENGLPVQGIKGIEWDSLTQMLWLATDAGIASFDGHAFHSYPETGRMLTTGYFPGQAASAPFLFAAAGSMDIYRLSGYGPQRLPPDTQAYMLVKETGLLRDGPALRDRLLMLDRITDRRVAPFDFFPLDTCWRRGLCVWRDSLFYKEGGRAVPLLGGVDAYVRFGKTAGGHTLLSQGNKAWLFTEETRQLAPVFPEGIPAADMRRADVAWVVNTNLGMPFLIVRGKLYRVAPADPRGLRWKATLVFDGEALPATPVALRMLGKTGVLALADASAGLCLLRPQTAYPATKHSDAVNVSSLVTYKQAELAPGIVLTDAGVLSDGRALPASLDYAKLYNRHQNIFKDFFPAGMGDFWYTATDSMYHYIASTNTNTGYPLHKSFYGGFGTMDGRLLFITPGEIRELPPGGPPRLLYRGDSSRFSRSLYISATAQTAPGSLTFGYGPELLTYIAGTGSLRRETVAPDAVIRTLYAYGPYLFIGTYGNGLFCRKGGVIRPLPIDKPGSLKYTHCIMPDSSGGVWLSSNKGLFRAGIAALCAAFDSGLEHVYYHHIGVEDGLATSELNGGCQPCALKLSTGALSFPSMQGLALVYPAGVRLLPPPGSAYIGFPGSDTLAAGATAAFPASMRQLSFVVSAPSWSGAANLYAWYHLAGYSDEWHPLEPSPDRPIVYNSLPPGAYTLEVKVLNGFGPADYRITRLPFRVMPPWYRTWWAWALWTGAGLAAIWLVFRVRLRAARRQDRLERLVVEEQLRALRAQINPHFLQNTFAFLSQTLDEQPKPYTQKVIRQLSAYLRNVLERSDEQVARLEDEIIFAEEYLAINRLLFNNSFTYSIVTGDEVDTFGVKIPSMLLQPLLENAVKHGVRHGGVVVAGDTNHGGVVGGAVLVREDTNQGGGHGGVMVVVGEDTNHGDQSSPSPSPLGGEAGRGAGGAMTGEDTNHGDHDGAHIALRIYTGADWTTCCEICNTIAGTNKAQAGAGYRPMGLAITGQRLALLYRGAAGASTITTAVKDGRYCVTIRIPAI